MTWPKEILGPTVVMVHGFLGFKDWAFFPWLANLFTQEGLPTVRFNFSGSGMGAQKDGPFTELDAFEKDTLTKQVEDLHAVLDAVKNGSFAPGLPAQEKAVLWGHSRGGGVCLLAAVNRPEVVGIATWATISRVNRYFFDVKKSWREKGFLPLESSRTGQALRYSTDLLDDVEEWGAGGDIPASLHRLKVPVLFIHGTEDDSVKPEESESLAALYPLSSLAILAKANHKFNASHPFTGPPPVFYNYLKVYEKFTTIKIINLIKMKINEIKLKIDGLEVKAESGDTILETALSNNIYIPNLCYYKGLKPWGSCRLCMVENDDGRLVTACETLVQDGMNVVTENSRINKVRKLSAELLIANHEVDCLTCRKNDKDAFFRHVRQSTS